jgi:hypothetical protein
MPGEREMLWEGMGVADWAASILSGSRYSCFFRKPMSAAK